MNRDHPQQLSHLTIALHWLIGIAIIAMLGVGLYMEENEVYSLYPIHKSIGMILLLFILSRVVWRAVNGWPTPVGTYALWEQRLAKLVHWVLLIGTVLLPLSGMMMSGAGGHGLEVFGLSLLPPNPDPANPGQVIALNGAAAQLGHSLHELLGKVMIVAIVLHIAGAAKHQLMDRDATLRRMLGKPS